MKAFLEFIIQGLVKNPDSVEISPVEHQGLTVYELRLHPDDIGRVVGREGKTINAIRTLLTAGSSKNGEHCRLDLIDEAKEKAGRSGRREAKPDSKAGE